ASLVVIVSLVPVMIPLVVKFYPVIASYIGYILIATSLFMILREKQKILVLIIFLLSGALGLGVFNLGLKDPLFPLLSGLFGISGLLLSIKNKVKIPVQRISYPQVRKSAGFQAIAATLFSGTLTSFLPGFSSAQAAILGSSVTKNIGDEGYLILVGGANTVNMILSVVALYVIDKARNGSIIAVSKLLGTLTKDNLILILACILVVGGIATILTLKLSKVFSGIISKVNYKLLCVSIISLIILLTFVLTGPMGFLVLVVSTSLGIIPQLKNIGRNHTMGCLLIPVILYFTL
ncbi:MAG TPA: tripartite tricarboxylate transporter permease, partial [Candidatus Nanoarchaeia archaeon]|nr:tripartite tricarboxylate transporter permease [Candidatus Nanoarchaeia archaeon]